MRTITCLNPAALFEASVMAYSQVAVSRGSTRVRATGQAALDRNLQIVGLGDLPRQVDAVFENLRLA